MKLKSSLLWSYLLVQFILFLAFLYFPLFSVENFFFFKDSNNIINILISLYGEKEWFLLGILFIGLGDLTRRANELIVTTYRPLEIYSFLVLEYLVLILIASFLVRKLEKKFEIK